MKKKPLSQAATPFVFTYDGTTAMTRYADGRSSFLNTTSLDDEYHARRLGIAARDHKGFHELCHHIVSIAMRFGDDCVIYRAAHEMAQPPSAANEEWLVTAWQYFVRGRLNDVFHLDFGALMDLRRARCDLERMKDVTVQCMCKPCELSSATLEATLIGQS